SGVAVALRFAEEAERADVVAAMGGLRCPMVGPAGLLRFAAATLALGRARLLTAILAARALGLPATVPAARPLVPLAFGGCCPPLRHRVAACRDLEPDRPLDGAEERHLVGRAERNRDAVLAGPRRPSD